MNKTIRKDIILGFFVVLAILIFSSIIYFIGSQKQLFSSNIRITSVFKTVSGLEEGNNVRLSGIKIGMVESIEIQSDTTVLVTMMIENDAARFIKKDALASIQSQGLMGNKIIGISSGSPVASAIEDGDEIKSESPVGINSAIESIISTADKIHTLADQLITITEDINKGQGVLGSVIADTTMEKDVKHFLVNLDKSGKELSAVIKSAGNTIQAINHGDGLAAMLIHDKTLARHTDHIIDSLSYISMDLANTSRNLQEFSEKLNDPDGTIDKLLTDSLMARDVERSIRNLRDGSEDLNGAIHTIENSWLLNLFGKKHKKKKADKGGKTLAEED